MKPNLLFNVGMMMMGVAWVACKPSGPSSRAATEPVAEVRGTAISSKPKPSNAKVAPTPLTNAAMAAAPTVPAPAAATPKNGEPVVLGFEKLASFVYEMPDETLGKPETAKTNAVSQIPERIRALDKSHVALKGFMLPLKVEGGLVTEMLIMKDQSMCCYGAVPKITEWVSVKMGAKGVKPVMDQPVTLHGQLKVGEIRENGFLVGIYAMDGEKMVGPLDL